MTRSACILTICCLFFAGLVMADIRVEGVVIRQFSITNIDKFPGFQFYYTYQSYHYNQGYRANPLDTLELEINKRYSAASRGNSKAEVLAKDKNGNWSKPGITLGGEVSANPLITGIVDIYEIVSIKKGVIKLKKIREIALNKDGTEKEKKASGGFLSFIGNDKFTGGLTIVAVAALAGLLIVFFRRKKQQQYVVMTT